MPVDRDAAEGLRLSGLRAVVAMTRLSFTVHVDCDDAAHGQRVAAAMRAEACHAADEVAIEMHNLCPTATTAFEITPLSAAVETDMGALPWNKGQPAMLWTPTPGQPEVGADWWVTVCGRCLTAICWHGEMMCDESINAGTIEKRASELRALNREHPENFSPAKLWHMTGVEPKAVAL